jgi:hypothetical protein
MLKRPRRFVVIESVDESQTLIEELLRLRILGGNRVMKVPEPSHQRYRMRLAMRGVVLGRSAQAQKHSTENVRQSFHLVDPPEFGLNHTYESSRKELVAKLPLASDAKPMPN